MEEEIHGENGNERGEEGRREREQDPGNGSHDGDEEDESDDASFDELLDVPALGNGVVLGLLDFPAVDGILGEFHDIAVGGAGGSESLSHRVFREPLESGHRSIEMPLGRAGTEDDSVDGSFVSEVKESGEYHEKEYHEETFFFVSTPDGPERKHDECQTSDDDADERTSRVGKENESEEDDSPESYEEMVRFFGSEIVKQESCIHEEEIRRGVRPVEDSLKSLDPSPIDSVVDGRCSAETPVTEIWRESKVNENRFVEHEPHEKSREKSETRGEEEYLQVLRDASREETASVFRDEEGDEKLEIISSAVYE